MKSELCWAVLGLALLAPAAGDAKSIDAGSEVKLLARITASSFVAKSEALSGTVDYDDASGVLKLADVVVKAASFTTGVAMRDNHMRDKYLEADKHPEIRFTVHNAALAAKPGSKGVLDGFFTVKGVKKPAKVEVSFAAGEGGRIVATSQFKVNISDFGIPQPSFAVVKMEPIVDVTVTLVLR